MSNVFGKYLPTNTVVHLIDARLKLLLTVMVFVATFVSEFLVASLILLLVIMIVYGITIKRIKPFFTLLITPILVSLFVFIINILTNKTPEGILIHNPLYPGTNFVELIPFEGKNDFLAKNARITINYNAIMDFVSLLIRIYTIILTTSLLTYTTKQVFLTKAIEFWIYPLKFLFIRIEIVSMIIAISMRFIPTLLSEAQRIMKAQASRGVDFKNGKLKDKAKSLITLIIPLFVSSFSKAEELAYAMETRGYNPYKARSKYRRLRFQWYDLLVFIFFTLLLSYVVVISNKNIIPIVNGTTIGHYHNYISFRYFFSGFNR